MGKRASDEVVFLKDLETSTVVCRCGLAAAGCLLLSWTAGCGAPSSDQLPGQESHAQVAGAVHADASRPIDSGNRMPGFPSDVSRGSRADGLSQEDRLRPSSGGKTDRQHQPAVPDAVAKDLDSPDAQIRLRALDHWGIEGTMAPLDPLFAAVDDEDDAVRAKAAEIIERYWAVEQE